MAENQDSGSIYAFLRTETEIVHWP